MNQLYIHTLLFSWCCVQLFVTPWTAARQASLSFTISQGLLRLMSIKSVMPSNFLIRCWPLSSYPQSFPPSGSFPVSQLFTSYHQSIAASASVLPMNIQDWFPLGWSGLISLQSKGLFRVFSRWRISTQSTKTRLGTDCGSDMNSLLQNSGLNWSRENH